MIALGAPAGPALPSKYDAPARGGQRRRRRQEDRHRHQEERGQNLRDEGLGDDGTYASCSEKGAGKELPAKRRFYVSESYMHMEPVNVHKSHKGIYGGVWWLLSPL